MRWLFCSVIGLVLSVHLFALTDNESAVCSAAAQFCLAEFKADEDARVAISFFSKAGISREYKIHHRGVRPGILFLESDDYFIVTGYKIIDVHVDKTTASVDVDYFVEARFIKKQPFSELVANRGIKKKRLHVVLVEGRWLVKDPDVAMIGRQAVIAFFTAERCELEKNVLPSNPSKEQMNRYNIYGEWIKQLAEMPQ